jgi:hypothetical protein
LTISDFFLAGVIATHEWNFFCHQVGNQILLASRPELGRMLDYLESVILTVDLLDRDEFFILLQA